MSSISVIIPAYNEAGNLPGTIADIVPLLQKHFEDYEILVFNDASLDETGKIADAAARGNPKIQAVHNPKNMGLGYNYKTGVKMACKDYVMMVPGDNEITGSSYEGMFAALKAGKDIVIPYTANAEIRAPMRQVLSKVYTGIINVLFGLRVRYFNGTVIHKSKVIQSVTIETDGFAYQAEALIKLIKRGTTYTEVPMYLKERGYGKTKAFNFRNVFRVFKTILHLFYQIRLRPSDGKT